MSVKVTATWCNRQTLTLERLTQEQCGFVQVNSCVVWQGPLALGTQGSRLLPSCGVSTSTRGHHVCWWMQGEGREVACWFSSACMWQTMLLLVSQWQTVITWPFLTISGLAGRRARQDVDRHWSLSHTPLWSRCSTKTNYFDLPSSRSHLPWNSLKFSSIYYVTDAFNYRITSNCLMIL